MFDNLKSAILRKRYAKDELTGRLYTAAIKGETKKVSVLLNAGADATDKTLIDAAGQRHTEVVKTLKGHKTFSTEAQQAAMLAEMSSASRPAQGPRQDSSLKARR